MALDSSGITFKLNVTFAFWSAIFDSDEANKRHAAHGIKPLFRGVDKSDPKKVIVMRDIE